MIDLIHADFHVHTHYSSDSLSSIEDILKSARKCGLKRIAITDHNTVEGAFEAYAMDPDLVIMGEEIITTQGEILALFIKEYVPPHLTPTETISRLREQGAFISISHPFDPFRSGWSLEDLEILAPDLDAVEVFNAKCFTDQMNEQAAQFAAKHNLPATAGSDAHWPVEVGSGIVELPQFSNADELRRVIRLGNVRGKRSGIWLRFLSPYIMIRKKIDSIC